MEIKDIIWLLHPAIAVGFVFPLIGIVAHRAWQTRQRRLQILAEGKSKIPSITGPEHLQMGRWLTGSVVGLSLLGLATPIFSKILDHQTLLKEPFRVGFVMTTFAATIASLVFLYQAKEKGWRSTFGVLTSLGLIVLGSQPEIYRRDSEWYGSHYYYGIAAAILMIISLAIVQEIYQDRKNRWRTVHIVLNCMALLLFIGQGFTGTRDLLEIPLTWQKPYVQQLYEQHCETQTCTIQTASPLIKQH